MAHYKVINIRYRKDLEGKGLPREVIVEVEAKASDLQILDAVEKLVGERPVSCNISMIQD